MQKGFIMSSHRSELLPGLRTQLIALKEACRVIRQEINHKKGLISSNELRQLKIEQRLWQKFHKQVERKYVRLFGDFLAQRRCERKGLSCW